MKYSEAFEYFNDVLVMNGPHIISTDFFIKAVLDSARNIDLGFNQMMLQENYLCAIPMIRQQLDNAMVALAGLVCKDEFFIKFAEGTPLNKMKDVDGKLMTSRNLILRLDGLYKGSKDLYDKTCKYVHLSNVVLQASWSGLIFRDYRDVKPNEDILSDYENACNALISVLNIWVELKKANAALINGDCCEIAVSETTKKLLLTIKNLAYN